MSVVSIAGGAQAYSSTSGGKVYSYNAISTVPAVVAPANPSRRQITFHNPGDVDILIAPSQSYNGTSFATLTPAAAISSRGGCFLVYGNGGTLVISGECQGAWQALSVSGAAKPLTVMDSNV